MFIYLYLKTLKQFVLSQKSFTELSVQLRDIPHNICKTYDIQKF